MVDMSDIVKKLRASIGWDAINGNSFERSVCASQMKEAADTIITLQVTLAEKESDYTALKAENKRLKRLLVRCGHILDNLLLPSEESTSEFGKEFRALSKDIKQALNSEDG